MSRGPALTAHETGTARGFRWHMAQKNTPCRPCLVAVSVRAKHQRDQGRCAKGLGWPLEARRG